MMLTKMDFVPVLLLLTCVFFAVTGSTSHLLTTPQPTVVEIGTNFTSTCSILDTDEITADDLYWKLAATTMPREQYTKINRTALSVTIQVAGEEDEVLLCQSQRVSANVILNQGMFMHGIVLKKAYPPLRPENVSCIALQEKRNFSPVFTCKWDVSGRQTTNAPTEFTLNFDVVRVNSYVNTSDTTSASVKLSLFPDFMDLEIWVEARNELGTAKSEPLRRESGFFVKTNAPANITIISEKNFTTSLLVDWTRPIEPQYVGLMYEIRFCQSGAHYWIYVPLADVAKNIQSFRLQNLCSDSEYVVQVRCKNEKEGYGYWSEWSTNATGRTPEDKPAGRPDVWRITSKGKNASERQVQILFKPPVHPNGRIIHFELRIQGEKDKMNGSRRWEHFLVNASEGGSVSAMTPFSLDDKESVKVYVAATNSVGKSGNAPLFVPARAQERPPVRDLRVWSDGSQMLVEWVPPRSGPLTDYVVEWATEGEMDWQREIRSTNKTVIKGELKKFVCYAVSVYPLYSGWIGRGSTQKAYLEQKAPLEGPSVRLNRKPGHNEAELAWEELPEYMRRGFITNYTISYTSGDQVHTVVVPPNVTSYTLTALKGNTKYDTWINATTAAGTTKGFNHSFTTLKYAYGEIEYIVVGTTLGFLFVFILTLVLCVSKKDAIKRNLWPQIPNPGESTIGNWSPDCSLKAETPKENGLSGISVLDVDVCDGRTAFDEDKTSLPLKKDKYLSEEHSSGIGGSSCMSSPRQSVSDSDEGGDMADASTVQYSSVVASSGYKGQTPCPQPQAAIFSRSESTQPLLDCEENPDTSAQDGACGRQSQRFFRRAAANEPDHFDQLLEMEQQEALDFCPLEEDAEQAPTEEPAADRRPPGSSYMPQLGGYRPQ